MDELLTIDDPFHWKEECQHSFELLKRKLVEATILKFPDWLKKIPCTHRCLNVRSQRNINPTSR